MAGRLDGKIAVITGTGSGQGRVAAQLFAAEGATVFGADVDAAGQAETERLVAMTGAVVDLTDDAAVKRWIDSIGPIDILYANAGATRFNSVADTTFDEWSWVLRHELDIVFLPVHHAWPHLREGGSIVLVGSTAGITGSRTNRRIAHTATKGGVVAMTKQLAAEGAGRGIRANCVSPGMIRTPATEGDLLADDHPMRAIASAIPLGRIGEPVEVVRAALFLASDEASYITGANLVIDGGWSAVLPG
ncbi:MAG: dehydrogenase [Micrococcales bacterium 70-64]|nr:SDR family oxidoreductase [Leifsonia sp.]ODU63092.1 MAG: dehydrogenase [Leifsonia sp. SCN 70-46]OJX84783.1 MAG: dehydrogenase [Micrococcales bacterium 70-64]